MVLLMENMNTLKRRVNLEKQARCENPTHLDAVSSDEEELAILISSVPLPPLTLAPITSQKLVATPTQPLDLSLPQDQVLVLNNAHIPTLINIPNSHHPPSVLLASDTTFSPAPSLALIAKVQAGYVPVLAPSPLEIVDPVPVSDPTPLTKFLWLKCQPSPLTLTPAHYLIASSRWC